MDVQANEYLERVRSSTQKMEQMIEGLLELSRLSRGEMEAADIDLSQIANSVAQDLKAAQPQRMVEFSIQDNVVGKGDSRLLAVALENLMGNAWKYSAKRSDALIEFGAIGHNGSKAYFVKDNGAGFDMTYADKLFGAFQRLHSDTEFKGTGIGLATVQRIVQRHGGKIWAEIEAERGATFYFTLESSAGGAKTWQRQVSLAG